MIRVATGTALLFLASLALATNRTVTNLNDSGPGSLRDIISASVAGDSIDFSVTGIITLTSGELTIGRNITINGPGPAKLTVQRSSATGTPAFAVFHISNGTITGPTVTIFGLTIRNGANSGVVNTYSTLTLHSCVITGNSNQSYGGGVYSDGSAMGSASALYLYNSTISNNNVSIANYGGGGVAAFGVNYSENGGSLVIAGCTFTGNGTGYFGGAVLARVTSCLISNSTFQGNIAADGGAISANVGATITNATISGNSASSQGGGIIGSCQLHNTIVSGNSSPIGPDLSSNGGAGFTSLGHNLIGKTDGSSTGWSSSDLTGTSSAPLDPHLGPLQNNGGPTQTMALPPNSAAVDAGDDAVVNQNGLTTDQRATGYPRLLGAHVDIGAYEFDNSSQAAPRYVVTTTDDHDDGYCGTVDCSLREAIKAANADGVDSTITFASTVSGTITLGSALPDITTSTVLAGPGARVLTVNGNNAVRVLSFLGGTNSVSALTITQGRVTSTLGSVYGAGIYNQGTLTVSDCALTNNQAFGSGGVISSSGGSANGGAIYNSGVLSLIRSTLSSNSATGGAGGAAFRAGAGSGGGATGALFNDTGGSATVTNCTIVNNNAIGGDGGGGGSSHPGGNGGYGVGSVLNFGTMTMSACTITANTGTGGAGGSGTSNGTPGIGYGGLTNRATFSLADTISSQNGSGFNGPDADGTFSSAGYNLISNATGSTGFVNGANHDLVGVGANLASLQNNGGPTDTIALLAGSLAINAGDPNAPPTDQRSYVRNGSPDIGAFEVGGTPAQLQILSIVRSGSDIVITVRCVAGVNYRLERTMTLSALTTWGSIPGVSDITATSSTAQLTDPNGAAQGHAFYRVRALP